MADEIKKEVETNIDEATSTDESLNTEEQKEVDNQRIPYDRFKAKVDEANAVKEKLAEIERQQEEAKRKELEESEQYKELYKQALETIEQQKEDALNAQKVTLLAGAGYDEEQTEKLLKLVEGETEDDIKASIEELKETFPAKAAPTYVDPSMGNGKRSTPESVDGEDVGRNMFESLLKSGKISG